MPEVPASSASFPNWIGFIFIFNVIVGTGALTLPSAFAKAGWLLSSLTIILLAIISYMTVTFVIEALSCANAVKNWQNLQVLTHNQDTDGSNGNDEADTSVQTPLLLPMTNPESSLEHMTTISQPASHYYYRLDKKFELGEMVTMFFNDFGRILFYLCLTIYLYGDLTIYSAAVAKSLRDIVCDPDNTSRNGAIRDFWNGGLENDSKLECWQDHTISRLNVYRLFLIGFTCVFGPLAAFSVQKTKYLQIITVLFRWLAFFVMISIAFKLLLTDAKGHPESVNFTGMPALFGAGVYSFMCHHSLPSLLAPIRDKLRLGKVIGYDYLMICVFYLVLSISGIFAFDKLQDLYTLNFIPTHSADSSFIQKLLMGVEYFLALFPVLTLSASFPIIAITLRNNLQTLFLDMSSFESYNFFVRRIFFPLCAVCPPFGISYFTESLASLVAFTGSYAGTGIQYIIPICLIYYARRTCKELLGSGVVNQFASPFRNDYWLVFILIWSIICLCLVTLNFFVGIN